MLSCDEKSPIQALGRTQKNLPLFPGRLKTLTQDYKRNGTTTLFAALELAEGKIISDCFPQHRHPEWLKFLKKIDAETPPNLDLHLIVDNDATHKDPKVKAWLVRHPRFHLHFTPTSSSWLNIIERWFRDLTQNRLRNGVFRRVAELKHAIHQYVAHHNAHPKSFVWTRKAADILEKVTRARNALNKLPIAVPTSEIGWRMVGRTGNKTGKIGSMIDKTGGTRTAKTGRTGPITTSITTATGTTAVDNVSSTASRMTAPRNGCIKSNAATPHQTTTATL